MNLELLGASSDATFFNGLAEFNPLNAPIAEIEASTSVIDMTNWEAYLAEADEIDAQAEIAGLGLSSIISVKEVDGSEITYQQRVSEINAFFETPAMRENEALMSRIAAQLALACLADCALGMAMLANPATSQLLERGMKELDGHDHNDHAHKADKLKSTEEEDDDEDGTSVSRRRRNNVYGGWILRGLARLN